MCKLYTVASTNNNNRNNKRASKPQSNRASNTSKNSKNTVNRNPRQGWQPPKKSNAPLISSIVGGILVVVIVVILIVVSMSSSSTKQLGQSAASADLVSAVTQIPTSVYNAVGTGGSLVASPPTKLKSPALTSNGKPEVLYMGDEWCPYCGAERWALIVALSRFGKLSGLETAYSSSTDVYPDTPTFTLVNVQYSSPYISFVEVEMQTVARATLQTPTAQESNLINKYSNNNIPFIDIGGKWTSSANYSPQVLQGLTQQSVAANLSSASSQTTQSIVGSANYLSATFCSIDGDQPADVCNSAGVIAAKASLKIPTTTSKNNHSHI